MKFTFILWLCVVMLSTSSFAESKEELWAAIAKRSDATITISKDSTGNEVKTAKFKGGVEIDSAGISMDTSGHGAVICSWGMLIAYEAKLKTCAPDRAAASIKNIQKAIGKTNEFIVKNSILPISKEEIDVATKAKEEMYASKGKALCTKEEIEILDKSFSKDDFNIQIDKMLSVPRPPVINPCM